MAVIDPHRRLSDNLNPLVKYFDETYGVSNTIENQNKEAIQSGQPQMSGSYSFQVDRKMSSGNLTIV